MGHLMMKRRNGEVFWVGDARIQIMDVAGGKVVLDILAPPEIIIRRGEEPKIEATEAKENQ